MNKKKNVRTSVYKCNLGVISSQCKDTNDNCGSGERMRLKGGKRKHKKAMEGSERVEVFDDTAGVYRAKLLCLSIQLKWIKGCNDWQTLLHWPHNSSTWFAVPSMPQVLTSAPLLLPQLPFPSPALISAPLPSPLYACVTVNLLFHKSHSAITLYCLWATYKACQYLCAPSIPLFHVKKIRSADWFVFVSLLFRGGHGNW